jgi:hypothetical protein
MKDFINKSESSSFMYMFDQGSAIWMANKFQTETFFAVELWFRYQHLRHSLVIVYDVEGQLTKTVSIKEEDLQNPCEYWSKQLELIPKRSIKNQQKGIGITVTPNCIVSAPTSTDLNWGWEEHKTYYYPDNISLSCPLKLELGKPFLLIGDWLIDSQIRQQLFVEYDEQGNFSSFGIKEIKL